MLYIRNSSRRATAGPDPESLAIFFDQKIIGRSSDFEEVLSQGKPVESRLRVLLGKNQTIEFFFGQITNVLKRSSFRFVVMGQKRRDLFAFHLDPYAVTTKSASRLVLRGDSLGLCALSMSASQATRGPRVPRLAKEEARQRSTQSFSASLLMLPVLNGEYRDLACANQVIRRR